VSAKKLRVNRAPVLTLWAAVVAERLGHDRAAALTLGRALAGMNAQSKGRKLGVYPEPPEGEREAPRRRPRTVELLGRKIPVKRTRAGLRAVHGDAADDPAAVERYLAGKLGEHLEAVRDAMVELASAFAKDELAARAYALYEGFRPDIPSGERGWGAKGTLDLGKLRKLAAAPPTPAAARARRARRPARR
jgi:hypothetical protein